MDVDDTTPSKRRKRKRKKKNAEIVIPQFSEEELEQLEKDRQELEAYRLKDKKAVLESFVEYLTEEELAEFTERLGEETVESLNQALSVIAMNKIREAKDTDQFSSVPGIRQLSNGDKNKSRQSVLISLLPKINEVKVDV